MITIVIARYNEDLKWLLNNKFTKYNIIVYNKGSNNNYVHLSNMTSINIKNVGRCDHTYLYHIIRNYYNLSEITVFLPGSCNMYYKMFKTRLLLNEINKKNKAIFLYERKVDNVALHLYNFKLKSYTSSYSVNRLENSESDLELTSIRPYGKWYKSTFDNIIINHISYLGIFSIAKNDILQHPIKYYIKLIKDLSFTSNPEVGHYFERSWEAVFYPMNETIKISYTDTNKYLKLLKYLIFIIGILLFIYFIVIII
jgi:hypothetical protein